MSDNGISLHRKMRPQILHLLTICLLIAFALAWTKEDHEIFRLRDEVEASEGNDVNLYDFLGVKASASHDEIQKAFRWRSKALHPDTAKHSFVAARSTGTPKSKKSGKKGGIHVSKGPSEREVEAFVKQASGRYGRLGTVANILKGESRERYDYFLKNGFPAWKGTGYYYNRFRPGLGSVLVGLFIVGGGFAHYGALVLGWKRQREFADRLIRRARRDAWGNESSIGGIPGIGGTLSHAPAAPSSDADPLASLNRRQKREMERQNRKETKTGKMIKSQPAVKTSEITPSGDKKRVLAENGKVFVVDSVGNVFLEEEDEDSNITESLIDIDEIPHPTFRDTAVYRIPIWLYERVADPFLKKTDPVPSDLSTKQMDTAEKQIEISLNQPSDSSQDTVDSFELVEVTGSEDMHTSRKGGKKSKK